MNKLELFVFSRATRFLHSLSENQQLMIGASVESVRERDFESAYVKTLRGPIKELIIRTQRIIFCIEHDTMYILGAFTKKSARTPKNEIRTAERIYKSLIK